ncbi:MAG: hypothetical protein KatS3mg101_1019 [Patescibacteria group bacterium]|nr:MAG: hypothetical protein KatS3mg101_1019 [Patescibacteria group bacterium]
MEKKIKFKTIAWLVKEEDYLDIPAFIRKDYHLQKKRKNEILS